ncbi:MAG: HD domain-containing protein, partial [Candidatus Dadabacteria bacterium]
DGATVDPPPGLREALEAQARIGWDAVHFAPRTPAQALQAWAEALARGETPSGRLEGIRMGSVAVGAASGPAPGIPAAEPAPLTEEVATVLALLAARRHDGVGRAREIVGAIAGEVAGGGGLLVRAAGLKAHDDYTHTHALNVCALAAALARALGAPRETADRIALAALCHDVGKERIRPEVLNKEGPLDPAERAEMERHPAIGAALLVDLADRMGPLLPVVAYQHHQAPDGSGYPAGTGRPHPASQLVAVCDVYDALRTARPYRGPLPPGRAATILLDLGRQGKLRLDYVEALFGALGTLGPGARVQLDTGEGGRVEEPGPAPLHPVVVTDAGQEVDLSREGEPRIAAVERVAPASHDAGGDGAENPGGEPP